MEKIRASFTRCPAAAGAGPTRRLGRRILWRRVLGTGIALGLAPWWVGCGMFGPDPPPPPKPPPPPPKLAINIVAAAQLNPDIRARPSPVLMRIYELKTATQFASADFMALFDQDRNILANDVVTREEFVMQPGGTKSLNKLLAPETQAIGVIAAFRDLERARWRGVATTPIACVSGANNLLTDLVPPGCITNSSRVTISFASMFRS